MKAKQKYPINEHKAVHTKLAKAKKKVASPKQYNLTASSNGTYNKSQAIPRDLDLISYLLDNTGEEKMKGTIRARGKCPVCNMPFHHIQKLGFICPEHKIKPDRYRVDVHHNNQRAMIYSNRAGQVLDSYGLALETLGHINWEIRHNQFDPTKYVKREYQKFLFQNIIKEFFAAKKDLLSLYKYESVNKIYFGFFTDKDVREIRTSHINDFYLQLPSLNDKTKKNILDSLKTFMNWLYQLEYIEKLPIFPSISVDLKVPKWLDIEEQSEILLALPEKDRFIYLFLALHGCRPSEARALKVMDLNFKTVSIVIRRVFTGKSGNTLVEKTKARQQRVIPINPDMTEILNELCKDKSLDDFVFTDSKTGKPYPSRTMIKRWQRACKLTNKKIGLYCGTKHSFASQRVSRGISIHLISKVLGHTNVKTTERYAQLNLEALRQAMSVSEPCLEHNKN